MCRYQERFGKITKRIKILRKKKSALIVGGTGFIGYHIAKNFLKKNWKVTSLSSKKPKKIRYLKKINYIILDISKKKKLYKKIHKDFDYVINCGGHVDHFNKKKTYLSHYVGVKNLANFFNKSNIKLFIQLGTGGEYGTQKSPQQEYFINRTILKNYYKAKSLATNYLLSLFKSDAFPVVILRLYQVYGPKQDVNRIIPITILSCLKNKKFACTSGKQERDFIHVNDIVRLINKILKKKNISGNIFNVGLGKTIEIRKLILKIRSKITKGIPLFGELSMREEEHLKIFPSIEKVKKIIGWQPKISFSKGLNSTINYYRKNIRNF